jgi:hypothetical protein
MKIVSYVFLGIPSAIFLIGLVYATIFMDSHSVEGHGGNLQIAANIFITGAVFALLTIPAVIYLVREVDEELKMRLIMFGSVVPIGLYTVTTILWVYFMQTQ